MYFVTLIFVALFICQKIGADELFDYSEAPTIGVPKVEIAEYPYMAFVFFRLKYDNKYDFCGGSIIGKRWILTAAHCVEPKTVQSAYVRVGSADVWRSGLTINISEAIIYKDGKAKLQNDIALLRLDRELNWSYTINCINLYSGKDIKRDTDCTFTGWEGGHSSEELRVVKLPIFERNKCNKVLRPSVKVTKKMICAGYNKQWKGGCDSGGPLVCKNKLVGIKSWRIGECGEYPDVFTNVASYRKWILKKTSIKPNKCGS